MNDVTWRVMSTLNKVWDIYLRRTHHYPKDVYSHRTRFEEAAIILHAMRAAERSTISLASQKPDGLDGDTMD